MKHLKKFNESREELKLQKEELQEFCEMYLAYLTDEGFELNKEGHIVCLILVLTSFINCNSKILLVKAFKIAKNWI